VMLVFEVLVKGDFHRGALGGKGSEAMVFWNMISFY